MTTRKRKSEDMFENSLEAKIDEIKNALNKKNIFMKEEFIEEGNEKKINIYLTDKDNNSIGKIMGGIGEFYIVIDDEKIETDAFSITWVDVDKNYQGFSLGTFLIIYCIYLCKTKYNYIEYIVLDDDTDQIDQNKNIYVKMGFIYQETNQVLNEEGQMITVIGGPEMQLKISDFFNNLLVDKLNKILITLKSWNKMGGKKSKKSKKSKRKGKKTKKRKS